MITLLDGPLGTELNRRGVATDLPLWSAAAIDAAPNVIAAIHRDYAEAGATVHTTNTFRTQRRTVGDDWARLARTAVEIARNAVPGTHRVAGSIAPLEDCYRPDLSPGSDSRLEHRELAELLADAGCDLLLCETFPHVGEAVVAVQESARTGVETWVALTAGPRAGLLSPTEMADGAQQAVDHGAAAALVNCTPATDTLRFVEAIGRRNLGVPIGAYANAGRPDDRVGWQSSSELASPESGARTYAMLAQHWIDAGATLIGGCCGTGPAHITALNELCRSNRG
jgi:S-methylmethionine-dependent homocysteine/selenocysteine methylase